MLLILAEYQKLCSPNTERYYTLQFIYITKCVFILTIFWYKQTFLEHFLRCQTVVELISTTEKI